jgi:hypothetical protein
MPSNTTKWTMKKGVMAGKPIWRIFKNGTPYGSIMKDAENPHRFFFLGPNGKKSYRTYDTPPDAMKALCARLRQSKCQKLKKMDKPNKMMPVPYEPFGPSPLVESSYRKMNPDTLGKSVTPYRQNIKKIKRQTAFCSPTIADMEGKHGTSR